MAGEFTQLTNWLQRHIDDLKQTKKERQTRSPDNVVELRTNALHEEHIHRSTQKNKTKYNGNNQLLPKLGEQKRAKIQFPMKSKSRFSARAPAWETHVLFYSPERAQDDRKS